MAHNRHERTKRRTQRKKAHTARRRTFLFVVGGVMSGVGKGIAASSLALTLKARGLSVTALKIDPYINVDAGTMNPTEHGEVFVLAGGRETDQDMGNYERFLNTDIPDHNYMTTGSVYQAVIAKERALGYGGRNVEVVPDIPEEVIGRIVHAAQAADADVTITEIGGTVGEYQNVLFLEAVRMMNSRFPGDVGVVMVGYLPVPGATGEMKTKPTQTAVRALNAAGVFADIIIARAPLPLDTKRKEKIARFCSVLPEHVISAPNVASIYDVPLNFEKDKLSQKIAGILSLSSAPRARLARWRRFVGRSKCGNGEVRIAVVGKYFHSGDFVLSDVYLSVIEAIKYSAYALGATPVVHYLSSHEFVSPKDLRRLKEYDGILVPGGFGKRGVKEKLRVINYARTRRIPFFGICYGMQLAVLEYAKNVLKLPASTAEINPAAKHLVIDVMPEQKEKVEKQNMGGTMRLGAYTALLKRGTIAARAYRAREVSERHRHRYEVNTAYIDRLSEAGLVFSGTSPDGRLMEIMELPETVHPFFVGVQFHPEFLARPLSPHPLFTAFIKAARRAS